MLKNFTADGFRGFSDITINPLKRFNLIVGRNNVGKTALLEAIFLFLGVSNPKLTFELNAYRGLQSIPLNADEIWGWLFYNRNTDHNIQLKGTDNLGIEHNLEISLKPSEKIQLTPETSFDSLMDQKNIFSTASLNKNLSFTYNNSKNESIKTQAQISQNQISWKGEQISPFPQSFYLPSFVKINSQENAKRFSDLEKFGQHEEIIKILNIIEPRLKRLSISFAGGIANINGDFGVYPLLPITYMGDGIYQLLSILLAIVSASSGGCVLIDEIEKGLYYAVMQAAWKAVCELANKRNVQIIATTHSWEFVKAAYQAHKENLSDEFCLHRLERIDNKISVISYEKEDLDTSFDLGWEVR